MFERFTDRARKVIALANQQAQRRNNEYIGTEHILLGLIKEGGGEGWRILKETPGVDLGRMVAELDRLTPVGTADGVMTKLPQTPKAKDVIVRAVEEARGLGHEYVGTEHVLLGLLGVEGTVAQQVLKHFRIDVGRVREAILEATPAGSGDGPRQGPAPAPTPADVMGGMWIPVMVGAGLVEKLRAEAGRRGEALGRRVTEAEVIVGVLEERFGK